MTTNADEQELAKQELTARLSLIETMIAEGRQCTESWGWTFVLWGVAYYVAIAWSTWGHSNLAWPVTMVATALVTALGASRAGGKRPETTMSRAIGGIWIAVGASLFIFCLCASIAGRIDLQTFVAAVGAMIGAANAASSIILKWVAQFLAALVWWTAAAVSCFVTASQSSMVFLAAIFLAQIVFGVYMMLSEARMRKSHEMKSKEPGKGAAHA